MHGQDIPAPFAVLKKLLMKAAHTPGASIRIIIEQPHMDTPECGCLECQAKRGDEHLHTMRQATIADR